MGRLNQNRILLTSVTSKINIRSVIRHCFLGGVIVIHHCKINQAKRSESNRMVRILNPGLKELYNVVHNHRSQRGERARQKYFFSAEETAHFYRGTYTL